ncbi:hypothetical protein JAAARDRAFT_193705 [Jaapia argillacea MUCL 33604]|uniref:Urea carboxylase n=1 Tax=Jaapia argillacea MUCL 33604 TaxID=933084 RepID=A0A067Q6R5_9AGAM|nr:hypothetical protein JAAARDRAFT_193705 [Jaapia argillacea MUCL 33604]
MSVEFSKHKLLVANRGEIAVRILRTAKALGISTVTIYTPADALAPHVSLADQSYPLLSPESNFTEPLPDSSGYLSIPSILSIFKLAQNVTLLHPGYGFLSENADFAKAVRDVGVSFLGPSEEVVRIMGLKHEARVKAEEAGVPVVPGSEGLLQDVEEAVGLVVGTASVKGIGWPVMLKSTAGGGGMGLVVCNDEKELRERFVSTQGRAETLFKHSGVFLERYFPAARHIEIQVFGNGLGHAIHMGERECSVQRRHQKVIEETPSPFLERYPGLREKMCDAAVRLCELIKYGSAGTVEFLVDDTSGEFYFLEMNTRLQVEHPITEATHPGLDLVELMILQGIAERDDPLHGLHPDQLVQSHYPPSPRENHHAIEARVYCENPAAGFKPCPGVLQYVEFEKREWLRVDHWISTGTNITPFFDPLACKLVVTGSSRAEAISRLAEALAECQIMGPPNNMAYLKAICESNAFRKGEATTKFLDTFAFTPRAMDVLSPGLETTIQDYPGRRIGLGIPRSGPMDSLAFRAANLLVSNAPSTEALELLTVTACRLFFHVSAVVAVTGAHVNVSVNGQEVGMWSKVIVPAGGKLVISPVKGRQVESSGCRTYLAVRGGFPGIPSYLGSKSTSFGLGGYQGRPLASGDSLILGACEPRFRELSYSLPKSLIPTYPSHWTVYCLSGPHDDEEFVTSEGIEQFYATRWRVSPSSNRMGIRLEGPKLLWARKNGGEGGSHPSNIHDSGYALGTVNVNGDTPVLLTNEGPDMGGYVCFCTVATGELWKLGQLRAGNTIHFKRVSFKQSMLLNGRCSRWLDSVADHVSGSSPDVMLNPLFEFENMMDESHNPKLHTIPAKEGTERPRVVFRQAGDSSILVEYGAALLDFNLRARIHAFELAVQMRGVEGIWSFGPCIRSTMCRYDPSVISQAELLQNLVDAENSLPDSMKDMEFPGRRITFPIVLDDRWNREAVQRYMRSIRDKAVYLPSNIEYLANNNGLDGGAEEALKLLISSDWLVFGVGFYLACPFLVPVDPRCRLVGQKMNPSRTYTPRGAIGIAGLVTAIYPIESPGGYQLYGRTLPAWETWGKGKDFEPSRPWLLQPFDQVAFEPILEGSYDELEKQFDAGRYEFKIEPATFSIASYNEFVESIAHEVADFKARQERGVSSQEALESELLKEWEAEKLQAASKEELVDGNEVTDGSGEAITSSLTASIWKIKCKLGDVIESGEHVVVILEAMKTEINIEAGEENVGKKIKGFGQGVREGALISAGDILVVLE